MKLPWKEIVIALILFGASTAISNFNGTYLADAGNDYGFPVYFYGYGGGYPTVQPQEPFSYFNTMSLAFDVIFWIIVVFVVSVLYRKIEGRSTSQSASS